MEESINQSINYVIVHITFIINADLDVQNDFFFFVIFLPQKGMTIRFKN